MKRLPVISIGVVLTAFIVSSSPVLTGALVYDRELIMGGELWRLITGHLVHWSGQHLCMDITGMLITGWIVESSSPWRTARFYVSTALLISLVLLIAEPNILQYGGLSGLVYGNVLLATMQLLPRRGFISWIAGCVLLLTTGRLLLSLTETSLISTQNFNYVIVTVPLAHLTGMFSAYLYHHFHRMEKCYVNT